MTALLIKTTYREERVELSYRDDSVEENRSVFDYSIARLYTSGRFIVVSSAGRNRDDVVKRALRFAEESRFAGRLKIDEQNFYKGSACFNKPVSVDDALDLMKKVCSELRSKGLQCEAVFVTRRALVRHFVEDYGAEAEEERWLNELDIYVYTINMGQLLSTSIKYVFMDKLRDVSEEASQNISYALLKQAEARRFNPMFSGSWIVVLKRNAACSLYHELAHLFEADKPLKICLNTKIGEAIKIYEDPFYPGPLQRLFDDEVYPAWRRVLVDNGVVVDYLRTRLSINGSRPGNGRGLFTKPKAMYHQLIVKPGDWSADEIDQEFKRLILVEEITKTELHNGFIRFTPEYGFLKINDQVQPIKHFELAIPINQLSRLITGLGEDIYTRFSYERGQPLYEVAPLTIIEMRVIS